MSTVPLVSATAGVIVESSVRMHHPIPLSAPDVSAEDRRLVQSVLNGRTLSLGPLLPAFEEALARAAGTKFAVAVNSGTSALHLCVKAAEIGSGDEVITTPFSFVASANCLLYEQAIPRFVDIDPYTYNIDVSQIAAAIGPRTRGILPVHVFGHPCDMPGIMDLASRHGLHVIEDSCEAIGAEIGGRRAGSFGESGSFAFYPNKQITTGEGGAVVTDDEKIARLCRSLRNQGRGEDSGWLQHERLGYNYRLSDINCALGLGQLSRLDRMLEMRRRVAMSYQEVLFGCPEVILPAAPAAGTEISWFVYVVRLQDEFEREDRDLILERLRHDGIACSNYFAPIHLQKFYQERFGFRRGQFPVTEHVSDRTIALPFFNQLTDADIDVVALSLRRAVHSVRRRWRPVESPRSLKGGSFAQSN
jgi:perosamine synthetase